MADLIMDGVSYPLSIVAGSLKRTATLPEGPSAGRMKDYSYTRDVLGLMVEYSMTINRKDADNVVYDTFYNAIVDPKTPVHNIRFPYGQGSIDLKMYVETIEDSLDVVSGAVNYWSNLTVTFKAAKLARGIE